MRLLVVITLLAVMAVMAVMVAAIFVRGEAFELAGYGIITVASGAYALLFKSDARGQ